MEQENDEGVAYLMALKGSATPPAASAVGPARETPAPRHPGWNPAAAYSGGQEQFRGNEKRHSVRYSCEGSAEMREEDCEVPTWATFTDVSLHGCYVEAQATYPVGTVLRLTLKANGLSVEAKGTVRVTYPYLGMGIAFLEISDDNRAALKELLGTVSHPAVIMGPGIASALPSRGPLNAVPLISDPRAALQALVEFFESRQMLMREDFLRVLSASQVPPPKR